MCVRESVCLHVYVQVCVCVGKSVSALYMCVSVCVSMYIYEHGDVCECVYICV